MEITGEISTKMLEKPKYWKITVHIYNKNL